MMGTGCDESNGALRVTGTIIRDDSRFATTSIDGHDGFQHTHTVHLISTQPLRIVGYCTVVIP